MAQDRIYRAFFSYAHRDAKADPKLVEALTTELERRVDTHFSAGTFEIWRDTEDLRLGDRWSEKLEQALRASDMMIALITPRWIGSEVCRREYRIFTEVEPTLGGGEFVAPLIGRPLHHEEPHFSEAQRDTWEKVKARQYKPIDVVDFLKRDEDQRSELMESIAGEIAVMLRRRREHLKAQASAGVPIPSTAELAQIQREVSAANEAAERRHQEMLAAIAQEKGVSAESLSPLLEVLGVENVPLAEIPQKLREAVDALREKSNQPVPASNEGPDVDEAVREARARLATMDAAGAVEVLDQAMAADKAFHAAVQRRVALLLEKVDIQRRSFDHAGAAAGLEEIVHLDPRQFWAWIDLGDLRRITGLLATARMAFSAALEVAGGERDESVAVERIGEVLLAEGDRTGALEAYRKGLTIAEALAAKDPGNIQWQRDLSVSRNKIGNVLLAEGDRTGALEAFREGLNIRNVLAAKDPGNIQWQRDLSVSHNRIGNVLLAEGDRTGALEAFRKSLAIAEVLTAKDPGNAIWQDDLRVSRALVAKASPPRRPRAPKT